MSATQIPDYRWPSGTDAYVCSLKVRIADLAQRFSWVVDHWEEDGLGPNQGVLLRLASGVVVALTESEHAIEHLGATGPFVTADLDETLTIGRVQLAAQLRHALELTNNDVRCDAAGGAV